VEKGFDCMQGLSLLNSYGKITIAERPVRKVPVRECPTNRCAGLTHEALCL
jgi:hypothetical protein